MLMIGKELEEVDYTSHSQRRETVLFSRKRTIKLDGKLARGLPGI